MKNRILSMVLMICMTLVFAGCSTSGNKSELSFIEKLSHEHDFSAATCTESQICYCGETQGEPLGHYFVRATCNKPETCARCNTTQGEPNGHDFGEATCTKSAKCKNCNETDGEPLGHDYVDNVCTRCEDVDPDSLPVGLNELFVIDSYNYEFNSGNFTDSFGKNYDGVHFFEDLYQSNNDRQPRAIFNLNKEYKKFTGSIVASTNTVSEWTYYINIYVDDVLKYSKNGFSKTTGKIDFEVNVKKGEQLKITAGIEDDMGDYHQELGIVNAQLYKK